MERRTQKTKPGPSGESLIKIWGTVIKTLGCVIDRVATGIHWNACVSVTLCLDSSAVFCLSQPWISSPCAWSTLSPYSLASAVLL